MATAPTLVHSTDVPREDDASLRRVRVLYYDDGSIRFRVYGTPLVIVEAYLQGGKNTFSIIKVEPRKGSAA